MSKTIIVVPCHNEFRRLNIGQFRRFAAVHKQVHFLLVNDGSTDNTLQLIEQLASAEPAQFAVLNMVQNGGKAEAVRRGVLQAAQTRRPDYIGFWDADLATPLGVIPDFVRVLDERPELVVALGVRMPLLGHAIRRRPIRRWLGRAFARVASLVLGTGFHDTQCGAKMFRAEPEILAAFTQPFDSRWIFDVEIFARLIRMRRETGEAALSQIVYEYALDQWEDVAGSKLKRGDFFKAVGELRAIWWRYLRPGAAAYIAAPVEIGAAKADQLRELRRAA